MTKIEHAPGARVLVGIDISKHRHEALIAVPGKARPRRVTLTNAKADFERLVATLSGYGLPVRIGFEGQGTALPVLVYRDQLFPRDVYRRLYDAAMAALPTKAASGSSSTPSRLLTSAAARPISLP